MISTLIENIPYGVLAGTITLLLALSLSPIARAIGLLDQPGGRKQHKGNIPLIGGICIFITFAATFFLAAETIPEIRWLVISTSLLLGIGIIDDFFDMRALYKLVAQAVAVGLMMWQTGLYVNHIAYLPDGTSLQLGNFGYAVTLLAVVGMINAFNMSDGIDGLTGAHALICIFALTLIINFLDRQLIHQPYLDIFRGAIGGYLLVNLAMSSKRKVFLGDAGSMMIGFICAWIVIYYTQLPPQKALPPSMALWLFAILIFDTLTVSLRRGLQGRSPMSADRTHLHHIYLRMGFNSHQALGIITLKSIFLIILGFCSYIFAGDIWTLILFIVGALVYFLVMKRIWVITRFIRASRHNKSDGKN